MNGILRVLIVVVLATTTVAALKQVTIYKCCGNGEYLTEDHGCAKNETSSWDLKIYNARKKVWEKTKTLPSHWQIKENTRPDCNNLKRVKFLLSANFPILNGSLFSVEYNIMVHPQDFCLDYESALICRPEPQNISSAVIKKCCGESGVLSANNSCKVFKGDTYKIDAGPGKTFRAGFPECKNKLHLAGEFNKSQLMNNGSLLLDGKILLSNGNYCLEYVIQGSTGRSANILTCPEYLPSPVRVEPSRPPNNDIRFIMYPIALALSVIFLAATLFAGSLLPANHHVLHWRCQTNHVACFLVGDVLLCFVHMSGKIEYAYCFGIAVTMLFMFLSAFFWLNTMCFNIWWTFRDLRPQSTEKSQERLRLRLYEAYAWGIPFIITLIAATLDLTNNPEYEILRPRFAENRCWFFGDIEKLTFFYGPMGILLLINFVLFALTARELTCGLWKRELVKSTSERAALGRVCLKLVVVMGISWIADIISFASGGPHELWYFTDLINCIHGVFIFIVVGCQPQVLSAVKRLWCLRKRRQNGTAGANNHHSSSSQGLPSMGDTVTNTNSITNGTMTKSVPLETTC